MNKWIAGLIVGLVIIAGGSFVLLKGKTSPETPAQNSTQTSTPTPSPSTSETGDGVIPSEVTINIKDFTFSPASIKVKKGAKVTWVNQDVTRHNAVSTSDSPMKGINGPLLAKGESYSVTLNEVGTYKYLCEPHAATMKASIEVVE